MTAFAQATRGFGWIVAWRMATRLLGLGSTLLLVRLLAPADFGLVALSSSFLQAVDAVSALGVEEAVVRAHTVERRTYDTAFTMILLRSALMAAAIALGAAPVAALFGEPRLFDVLLVTAGITLLAGFENVGVLDFRRDMRFDREFYLQLLPRLAGVVVTITIALAWRNYWALVAGAGVQRLLRLPLSYLMHPHRPRPTLAAWRELVGFSLWTWVLCMVRVARDRVHVFVLGRVLGTATLGVFSVAGEIAALPYTELIMPMGRAMFSAIAQARRTGEDAEAIWLRVVGMMVAVTFPAGVGIALVAEPLVHLMLGPQWGAAVPLLQVFAVVAAITGFDHFCHIQLDASGLIHIDFRAVCVTAALRIAAAGLVPFFGMTGAIVGLAVSGVLEQAAYLVTKSLVLPFHPCALWRRVWRPGVATLAMAGAVLASGLGHLPAGSDAAGAALHLGLAALLGAAVYAAVLLLAWRLSGGPDGVEADALALLRARLRRVWPARA